MSKSKLRQFALACCSSLAMASVFISSSQAEPMTFQSAVAEYKAGKYQAALPKFKAFAQANPNNIMARYYLALCHHALGHVELARQDYNLVISNGDASYKALAQNALTRLGSKSSSGASTSSPDPNTPSQVAPNRKAKKVIDFYADW
mgnify:CR=1 FL=1